MKYIVLFLSACLLISCNWAENHGFGEGESGASEGRVARTQPISGHIEPKGSIVSFADTVDLVAPAVLTVHAERRIHAPEQFQFQGDPFFNWLFGQNGAPPNASRRWVEEKALGSGVIVRSDGYILTNDHVVDGAQDISVDLVDRRTFKAKVIGADKPSDLAVLKIDTNDLPVLALGNSDQVRVGDVCLAVGNPLGIGETVTAGIISAKGRQTGVSDGSFEDFLQTDAAINQGNSGGALVNTRGELIGINSQILSSNGGNIGIGFAIPSNMAKNVMDQLIAHGKVSRGELGVTVQYVTSGLASSLGLKNIEGVLVSGVQPGGPAEKAGIKPGDVILNINGTAVNDVNELRNTIAAAGPGNEVTLTIFRNGANSTIKAKLGEANPKGAQSGEGGGGSATGGLGLQLTPLTPGLASQLGIPQGTQGLVVSSVDPNGAAAAAGVHAGDVIQQINHETMRATGDVAGALAKSDGRPALLQVQRGGQSLFLAVPLK